MRHFLLTNVWLFICVFPGSVFGESIRHVDVFTSGKDGYHSFRIPAIETAPNGSLIALAEARKHNQSDPGHEDNDIRSPDVVTGEGSR